MDARDRQRRVRPQVPRRGEGGAARDRRGATSSRRAAQVASARGRASSRAACSSASPSPRCSPTAADVLLLDEPFGALDYVTKRQLHEVLLELWSETATRGRTVLFVTHDVDEALILADRILVMSGGQVVEDSRSRRRARARPTACSSPSMCARQARAAAPPRPREPRAGGRRAGSARRAMSWLRRHRRLAAGDARHGRALAGLCR